MDLVEVSATATPPVCRVMDYGKFKYEQQKKQEAKKRCDQIKEIKVRPKTDDHDYREPRYIHSPFSGRWRSLQDHTVFFRGRGDSAQGSWYGYSPACG